MVEKIDPKGQSVSADVGKDSANIGEKDRWYMVHVQSGKEFIVKAALEKRIKEDNYDKIKDVSVPVYNETVYKNGKKRKVEKKSYPGYICVQMKFDLESQGYVREIPYVTNFVTQGGGDPYPLSEKEMQSILKKDQDGVSEAQTLKVDFDIGQKVLIVDGPFNNFSGTITDISPDKGKISVSIEIFGRQTPVEIDYYKVKKR